LIPYFLVGQEYADNVFYLLDSLVLNDLTQSDISLLDSSLAVYHSTTVDTNKIIALARICDYLVSGVWGQYQFIQYELIKELLKKKITTKEKSVIQFYEGGALNNLGLYYEHQEGNSSKALDYYLKALKLNEDLQDQNGMAMMYNRLGTIYTEQREIANPLNSIGLYFWSKGNYHEALDYFQESLKIDLISGNGQGVGTSYSNIGRLYVAKKEYDKALISFIKGLKVFEKMGDQRGISLISRNIGDIYYIQGDSKSAFINAKRSYDIAQEIGFPDRIRSSSLLLSQIYEMQNKPSKALEMFKLYEASKDSLTNENTKTDAVRQQSKYEYNKQKAVDDAVYDKQLAIEKEAKEKQKIIIYAIGFGITLLAVFLIFVFNRLQITRKQKTLIESQKKDVEEAHEELSEKNQEIL
jgi:tetratricopeptide (TPR) repeat protein